MILTSKVNHGYLLKKPFDRLVMHSMAINAMEERLYIIIVRNPIIKYEAFAARQVFRVKIRY